MKTIAALGPESTFSEIAARLYAEKLNEECTIQLFPTIKKVFSAVGEKCSCGILPIENLLEGYVVPVLDLQLHSRLTIVDELLLPIRFAFVSHCSSLQEVRRVFVQFVSQGQCSEFLDGLPDVELVTTQSNGESLQRTLNGAPGDGAVVSAHALATHSFPLVVENINDFEENKTRFIVVSEQEAEFDSSKSYKTSLVIIEGVDRPGMLTDILAAFSRRNINLVSIMSRPTKESMGKYHFFIDIEGYARSPHIREALAEVRQVGYVKLLGSYPRAVEPVTRQSATLPHEIPCLASNPFLSQPRRPGVLVASGPDPYANTRQALAGIDLSVVKGKRVLLKPNIGRVAASGSGIVTNCQVVAAAIDAFCEAGATVAVGESPITGVDMAEAFEISGIAAVAASRGCPCIDMDKRRPVELALQDGVAIDKLKVCADLFDFDLIVSIPVMKMHMHTVATLSVKNMKGCLWSRSKVELHMLPNIPFCDDKPLNVAIADMASLLRPHLAIIDGSVGLEGLGPSAGDAKELGVIVVGADPFAADSVACRLMGISAQQVPHLRIGAERGYGVIAIERIAVSPPDWQKLAKAFAPVPTNLTIEFPNVEILDEMSCSACQSTVLLFLKRYGAELFDYFPSDKPVSIVIGKGHKSVPPNAICIGNCTRRFRELGTYISGCPPVASAIIKTIKKQKGGGERKSE